MINLILKFFLFVAVPFSIAVWAQDISIQCEEEAELYGDGKGHNNISEVCVGYVKQNSAPAAKEVVLNEFEKAWGYRGIIVIENSELPVVATRFISGKMSELKDIAQITYDVENDELVVLEAEDKDVLFFSGRITGNVAPYRVFKTGNPFVTSVAIDGIKGELTVTDKNGEQVYDRLVNSNARHGKRKERPLR